MKNTYCGKPMKITIEAKEGEPKWDGAQWLVYPMDVQRALAEGDIVRILEN